tara:strand:+ start:16 stop:249 length:234 start_codon:yes stop_codon:yes gene_type:complete
VQLKEARKREKNLTSNQYRCSQQAWLKEERIERREKKTKLATRCMAARREKETKNQHDAHRKHGRKKRERKSYTNSY